VTEQTRSNLRMVGTTTTSGGHFKDVSVTGECTFNGEVDCKKLGLTGELKITGNLLVDELKITGECSVEGRVVGSSLKGRGALNTSSSLVVERIRFTGNIAAKGNCESEKLTISGAIQVEGLLSAEELELAIYGPSRAIEVGGGSILIKRSTTAKIMDFMKPGEDASFTAEVIEGDHIQLQSTRAGMVRGKHIIIGSDCDIHTVEYRDTLEIHRNAKVKHQVKL